MTFNEVADFQANTFMNKIQQEQPRFFINAYLTLKSM